MSMQSPSTKRYTITEAKKLSGLPESTLRYYETIGIINPIERDSSTKRRVYSEDDLSFIDAIACLSATGMSINEMRSYMANRDKGVNAAFEQKELLQGLETRLIDEEKNLKLRQKYVGLKIRYWEAITNKDTNLAEGIAAEAGKIAKVIKLPIKQKN